MAQCKREGHRGDREVFRIHIFYMNGEKVEGCSQCTSGMLAPVYSTEKRNIVSQGTHKSFSISPAHVRHIKLRKLAPDGRTVYQNRRGNVT